MTVQTVTMTSCQTTLTRTLQGTRTTRVVPIGVTTTSVVVPVGPTVRTRTSVATSCESSGCTVTTRTILEPVAGTSSTRTSTVARGSRTTIVSLPTSTVYESTCIRITTTTTQVGVVSVPSATSTDVATKTLVDPENPGPGGPPNDITGTRNPRVNVGAIVGGLIGGFVFPILMLFLIRWLRRKHALRSIGSPRLPGEDMRSIHGSALSPTPSRRPSSPNTGSPTLPLHRSGTMSDSGHAAAAAAGTTVTLGAAAGALHRHTSRGSTRVSRTSYDRRGAISPVSSNFDYPVAQPNGVGAPPRRLNSVGSTSQRGGPTARSLSPSNNAGGVGLQAQQQQQPGSGPVPALGPIPIPPVPPPLPAVLQPNLTREVPSPIGQSASASTSSVALGGSSNGSYPNLHSSSSPSVPHGYVTSASPYDHNHQPYRRAVSPVSLADHPYAHAQPVPTGERAGSPEVMMFGSGPSSHGHGLQSVEENSYEYDEEGSGEGPASRTRDRVRDFGS